MRRPKHNDCMDENDEFDSECYDDAVSQYEDFKRDEYLEKQAEIGDQIHEQRREERDELPTTE